MTGGNGGKRPNIRRRRTSIDDASSNRVTVFVAFCILLVSHLFAAAYAPIQDCDEVFNFWEPTHYLNHGSGLQTWELSPVYAIRSWMYIGLHAIPIQATRWLSLMAWPSMIAKPSLMASKVTGFYALRAVLALVCATCEANLFSVIARNISARIATFFLIAAVTSAGMFHAATSYLSSTFAMYSTVLALAAFMDRTGGNKTAQGLTWLGLGTILGWPFVAVICLPFVVEELFSALQNGEVLSAIWTCLDGAFRSVLVLGVEVLVDGIFYHKATSVPFNIVLYNVFSDASRGPDIYGTEPWHFYIRNLLINFNIWFLLAIASLPIIVIHAASPISANRPISYRIGLRGLAIIISPLYIWLAIFTVQPHKEERFMYPVYPSLALNAAIALHTLLIWLGQLAFVPAAVKIAATATLLVASALAGVLRIILLGTAYTAPLRVYRYLPDLPEQESTKLMNVCVGKEWYRFPSSYHLPPQARLRFIKSEFSGLLPGPFFEDSPGNTKNLSRLNNFLLTHTGTWRIPEGMNDLNQEDLGKYMPVTDCDYIVDSRLPSWIPTELERDFISEAESSGGGELGLQKVYCDSFLDQGSTGVVGRMIWLPNWNVLVPSKWRGVWGDYCLLARRR